MADYYVESKDISQLLEKGFVKRKFQFPLDPEEFPLKKFNLQYREFNDNLKNILNARRKLSSIIRLCVNSKELRKKLETIARHNGYNSVILQNMINSEKLEDFENYYNEFRKKWRDTRRLATDFEKELLSVKISKVPT